MSKKKSIKTKFKCEAVTHYGYADVVELTAVPSGAVENESIAKEGHPPAAKVQLQIEEGTPGYGMFKPRMEYIVEITEAEATIVKKPLVSLADGVQEL